MLTAFRFIPRHTGIRNVFIVWNSDSLLFHDDSRQKKNVFHGVERGCRAIGIEQDVLAVVTFQ